MSDQIVLDSFGLVCLFHKEPGWEKMQKVFYELSSSGRKALLSIINWGEFYYTIKKHVGKWKAEEALDLLSQLPIKIISVDDDLVKESAEIKSDYPLSYADAFCIATAKRAKAEIITNDQKFKSVQHLVSVIWLNDTINLS